VPTLKMKDVMVDLETVGKRAGCGIVSIGAVEFSPLTGDVGREFYVPVNIASCEMIGLETDPDTMAWWARQSKEAQAALRAAKTKRFSRPVTIALERLSAWLEPIGRRSVSMWGCGAGFDEPILVAAYHAAGLEVPWEFWNCMCHRTLKNLFKVDVKEPVREGVFHNALDDARHQARHAIDIFSHLREMRAAWAESQDSRMTQILKEK
jgi:hypothetical protein